MIRRTGVLDSAARAGFDAIIDVRSPAEFTQDHVPGAINLPVLDDAERAEVGTVYVRQSKFLARRLGAAKVARNIAAHLDGALSGRDGSFRPLIYCWRGGQRSGAMAAVMDQIGWPVTVLEGGYMTWRRRVTARLYDELAGFQVVLLDGPTGSGKTEVLGRLAARGVQTLDLEGLANHRGSLFGAMPGGQPSQKLFETHLFEALEGCDPTRPLVVEAESSRVGARTVPPVLWAAMGGATVITLEAPLEARARHIVETYGAIASDPAALDQALSRLPRHHSKARIAEWRELAGAGQIALLVHELIAEHYDPAYGRTARSGEPRPVSMGGLTPADLDRAADEIARLIQV